MVLAVRAGLAGARHDAPHLAASAEAAGPRGALLHPVGLHVVVVYFSSSPLQWQNGNKKKIRWKKGLESFTAVREAELSENRNCWVFT